MNLKDENRSSQEMSLEDLVQMNGEAMAVMDEVPYQPMVYAVPMYSLNHTSLNIAFTRDGL